jgi:DNA-binding NarL/FixJ family response regulator
MRRSGEWCGADCTSRPDLIVLDLSMPVMNGLQAAPLLKEKLPQTPIIMFTMHATDQLVQIAIGMGISAVVSKEEPVSHLISKADSMLKRVLHRSERSPENP